MNSPSTEIDEWLRRAPDDGQIRRDLYRAQLDKVRECGYSLLAAAPGLLQRQQAALSAFELSDRLPRHERAVRQATSELAEVFSAPTSYRANGTTSHRSSCPCSRRRT